MKWAATGGHPDKGGNADKFGFLSGLIDLLHDRGTTGFGRARGGIRGRGIAKETDWQKVFKQYGGMKGGADWNKILATTTDVLDKFWNPDKFVKWANNELNINGKTDVERFAEANPNLPGFKDPLKRNPPMPDIQPESWGQRSITLANRRATVLTQFPTEEQLGYKPPGRMFGDGKSRFVSELKKDGISPDEYLKMAREKAKKKRLNWKTLDWSDDKKHKLQITADDGSIVRIGAAGLGDHIYYSLAGDATAAEHRKRYLARATKIRGDWKKNKYSPNSLAIAILW